MVGAPTIAPVLAAKCKAHHDNKAPTHSSYTPALIGAIRAGSIRKRFDFVMLINAGI
jgi:hypothetical protein